MTIVVSGSLAFDRLAEYSGLFADSILPEQLDLLNVCFLVDKVERVHGGTAGNIAYNLALLGESPLIVTCLGDDPDGRDYLERLKEIGLSTANVDTAPNKATAGAYIATDKAGRQLLFFNPGAMMVESSFDPAQLIGKPSDHLAIVSPGGFSDMKRLSKRYKELELNYIFDPGQQIPAFNSPDLLEMLDGSVMLITNDYELELFKKITGLSLEELFRYTSAVLTTLGERGSRLNTPRGSQHVMAVEVNKVVNPTGAGDAYRAGLLAALYHREALITACRLGSTIASFCVEASGTQGHHFTPAQVLKRHFKVFNETPMFLG
ncbi:MAG: carbohydrate kinase family protein [Deltaproteobacteria bacterium]|jgi:adenosine kinase|nr:carbohydrate kinase family protein [Deltaproteobacteria bacterium]